MPFVTACSFCPNKIKVPDQSLGASLRCSKCGNYFTVAPAPPEPIKNPRRPAAVPSHKTAPAEAPPPPVDLPWWVAPPPGAASPPVRSESSAPPPETDPAPVCSQPLALPSAPALLFPEPPSPATSALPGWINAWGVAAFVLTALALLFAAFALPRFLTLSLTGLGLLAALAGVVAAWDNWQIKDGIWLTVAGGGSGLLLLLALFAPDWLNDRWGRDFVVPEPDLNEQMMVSRDNNADVKKLDGGDRVNAETYAIRQGDIVVRVESARVDRMPGQDQPVLLIALHIANVGYLHNVTYRGQASGEQRVLVRDSRGTELQRRDLGDRAKKAGQAGTVSVLPTHETKDLLVVEAPWAGTAHVDVDLPAAAWGRQGVCKFTLPATFIVRRNRSK
jgi:hypothetical protein